MNFRTRLRPDAVTFQLAPMIDVVFLLLSFFVTSQIFAQWETAIDISLPTARTAEMPRRMPGEVILNVRANGEVVVHNQVLDDDALGDMLRRLAEVFPGQAIVLRADRDTPYGEVIRVLDHCRQADIWNLSFATAMPEAAVE